MGDAQSSFVHRHYQEDPMGAVEAAEMTQYLTFKLGDEVFALTIDKVREVLDFTTLTRVPKMPEFMRGVINLRGSVVPVADLRLKFGMTQTEKTMDTCVIIAEVTVDGETAVIGALADSVQEVLELEQHGIEPPPKIGARLRTEFIKGMGMQNERFIIILDLDKIFSAEELLEVQAAQAEETAA